MGLNALKAKCAKEYLYFFSIFDDDYEVGQHLHLINFSGKKFLDFFTKSNHEVQSQLS